MSKCGSKYTMISFTMAVSKFESPSWNSVTILGSPFWTMSCLSMRKTAIELKLWQVYDCYKFSTKKEN